MNGSWFRSMAHNGFSVADIVATNAQDEGRATPVIFFADGNAIAGLGLSETAQAWLTAINFRSAPRRHVVLPRADGSLEAVILCTGDGKSGDPSGPSEMLAGQLAQVLPPGHYTLGSTAANADLAAIAWGLGGYRFRRYKGQAADASAPRLTIAPGAAAASVTSTIEAIWLGRDLINTPASDLGPAELEDAARTLAARHDADIAVTTGDDLLTANLPLIHAVGRASTRAPRLIDMRWGQPGAPAITLVGKGICFDTGGLDIKPSSGMLIMKKDMGGAATALALAHMIMSEKLNIRLRVLIPAAENSISGNAFRPGDVLDSRSGTTVEVGNTDAEGRLVLADALTLADEESPHSVFVFATLTGAARVALGPDLPAMFSTDDALANELVTRGAAIGDPMWRLPLWPGYRRHLDSEVADTNNVWEAPFAGAIIAALFLKRFSHTAGRFTHIDLFGWRPQTRPLGPKGGEPQSARAVMDVLRREFRSA